MPDGFHYTFLQQIGRGTFGEVWKVRRSGDDRVCVIKQVDMSRFSEAERSQAINEVKLLATVDSPHVITYYESFVDAKTRLNIVMEYADRGALFDKIQANRERKQPLAEDWIWTVFLHTALALYDLHQNNILHRDLKSANIFLCSSPNGADIIAKLGDFGVAKAVCSRHTMQHTMVGTPYYLSPELCMNKPYGEKSDVWALGVVLYELCCLRTPFSSANSQAALVLKIIQGTFPPIPGTQFSVDLCRACYCCLNTESAKRPTVKQLLQREPVHAKARQLHIRLPASITGNSSDKVAPISSNRNIVVRPSSGVVVGKKGLVQEGIPCGSKRGVMAPQRNNNRKTKAAPQTTKIIAQEPSILPTPKAVHANSSNTPQHPLPLYKRASKFAGNVQCQRVRGVVSNNNSPHHTTANKATACDGTHLRNVPIATQPHHTRIPQQQLKQNQLNGNNTFAPYSTEDVHNMTLHTIASIPTCDHNNTLNNLSLPSHYDTMTTCASTINHINNDTLTPTLPDSSPIGLLQTTTTTPTLHPPPPQPPTTQPVMATTTSKEDVLIQRRQERGATSNSNSNSSSNSSSGSSCTCTSPTGYKAARGGGREGERRDEPVLKGLAATDSQVDGSGRRHEGHENGRHFGRKSRRANSGDHPRNATTPSNLLPQQTVCASLDMVSVSPEIDFLEFPETANVSWKIVDEVPYPVHDHRLSNTFLGEEGEQQQQKEVSPRLPKETTALLNKWKLTSPTLSLPQVGTLDTYNNTLEDVLHETEAGYAPSSMAYQSGEELSQSG